ncbi:MAG: small basic protein [Phycisphaerales bacterium]|nr:small basic protein [Phycisphaerales bacterium]
MSLHKTLKSKSTLVRHRNVLNRAERVDRLKEEEKWRDGRDVFGLPKVAHRKVTVGGKDKKEEKATEEGAAAATEAGKTEAAASAKPGAKGAPAKPGEKTAAAKPGAKPAAKTAAKPGGKAGGK